MVFEYRNVKIFYRFVDRHKVVTNIFLHGWGADSTSFLFCEESLQNENSLYVDFPPFGKSGCVPIGWTIFTYANMVISLCEHLKITKFNLIGHSFGGRVAILVATLCKTGTEKLVLIDSAGVKPRRGPKYHLKVWTYKIRKKLGLDVSKYGSSDYRNLSDEMKPVFNNIVSTHLDEFLPLVKAQTLIIFGEKDKTTPLYMAKKLHKKIKQSELVIIKDAGHFCFAERHLEVLAIIRHFIGEK
ncbi:MAG: alpha/beta hydrolase [Clostridia bacterium]|nr:alpha/beta hydrolase [Clostridia bacterium]